ncbi:PQQ-binding-like beta-propeller repeat protein [Streptomyces sp. G1]|uniref:outer membrane protein assembly factor BamB family protein n=1 Tax=Streptomyces sp. G1 TaxID=361572 RepID=UPI002030A4F3|nr:PQQ-binding-like beta-propeller repeat protein [Streptomyces sp. G1]MCM1973411.1 PQQ-like beta-propeller repeat protein [Streptomyces sp. G1]
MTTPPPPPPNQPPQGGGFGPPQDEPQQPAQQPAQPPAQPPAQQPGFGAPQPPAQQGGFGAPQAPQTPPPAPPQGGFGAPTPPQQPAAQPPTPPQGYGYPQPPTPPQGYGYPQTPPQGYGYPGQPGQPPTPAYGQQPYGYPQPPTMPMQPQPGTGGGRKLNSSVLIIVAAVVAIALIVTGGIWYASSSDDGGKDDTASSSGGTGGDKGGDKGGDEGGDTGGQSTKATEKVPSDPNSKVLFQVPAPEVKDDRTIPTVGSWVTDKVYAKSGVAEVVGYDLDKGTKLWTIKLPGPVCQGSNHATEDNRTAITFQPKMPTKSQPSHGCTQVAGIDLDTGKKLWTKTVESGTQPISFDNVTVSGSTVAVGSTSGGAGFDIATGDRVWAPKATDTCYDAGYGGGPKLVAVRKCGSYGERQLSIQTLDSKSGKVISEYKMAKGIEYASVVSTEPLVVAADVGDSAGDASGISDFFSIDNKTGKLRSRISAPGEQFNASCDGITKVEECRLLAVGNDRLYLPTEKHDGKGEYSDTNEIIAFDLATGKQTGQRADAGDDYELCPLRMDGPNLIAYKRGPYDKGGQVVSIDGGSFKETKLMENPATESVMDVERSMLPDYAEILYTNGRLFMSDVFASELGSSGEEEYLVIAFGAK